MEKFVAHIPKCELHIHIEGSFEPEMMFALSKKNNVPIKYKTVEEVKEAYNFSCLQDFLDLYYAACSVLLNEQDFYDLAYAYAERAAADSVKVAEIFFDPQTHTDRGVSFETVINGLHRAFVDAKSNLGFEGKLIMCFLRHLSGEEAMATLMQSLPHKDKILGVGLDSSEKGRPPSLFTDVYAKAIEEGFLPVAHAGEEGPPEYIEEALDLLHCKRIDHGVACVHKQSLVDRLVKEKIGLTMCPLSNIKLCVYKDLKEHPLKVLLDQGVMVSINSDDPSYFGGYMNSNFHATVKALNLSREDVSKLCKNSFMISFLPPNEKESWVQAVQEYYEKNKDL